MTEQDNILRLAREAFELELIDNHGYVPSDFGQGGGFYEDDDVNFAWDAARAVALAVSAAVKAEAVAETREACAKVLIDAADKLAPEGKRTNQVDRHLACVLLHKAGAIRAMAATPSREGEV